MWSDFKSSPVEITFANEFGRQSFVVGSKLNAFEDGGAYRNFISALQVEMIVSGRLVLVTIQQVHDDSVRRYKNVV